MRQLVAAQIYPALTSKAPTQRPFPPSAPQNHTSIIRICVEYTLGRQYCGTHQQITLARTCAPLRRFSTLALRCASLSFFLTVVSHTKSVPAVLPPSSSVLAGTHVTCFPSHRSPSRRGSKRAIDAAPVMLNVNLCPIFWNCACGICSGVLSVLSVLSIVLVPAVLRTDHLHKPPS